MIGTLTNMRNANKIRIDGTLDVWRNGKWQHK
jgi:hypothetical protein